MPLYEMLSVTYDCILILDAYNVVTFANTAFFEAEGLGPETIIGKKIFTLNLKMVSDDILNGLESAGPGITLQKELIINADSNVRIFNVKMIGTVLHGGIHGITIFYEDITKKRLCQERLKSSEKLYRAVVEDQTELLSVISRTGPSFLLIRHTAVHSVLTRMISSGRNSLRPYHPGI